METAVKFPQMHLKSYFAMP